MLRILLVDDNTMARKAIKAALQKIRSDWVVIAEASDGRAAVNAFPNCKPHITIMDFVMPELNGVEAARRIMQRNPDTLILLITTDPSPQLQEEARKAGIRGVCAKEKMSCLEQAIETVMQGGTYFWVQAAA